jgi:hypothetical protein
MIAPDVRFRTRASLRVECLRLPHSPDEANRCNHRAHVIGVSSASASQLQIREAA